MAVLGLICLLLLTDNASFADLLRQGLAALSRNQFSAAQSALEQAARLQPANAEVWLALAQTYWKSGRQESARAAVGKAESLGPDEPQILHGLAIFYSESGDPARAASLEERYAGKVRDPQARARAAALYLDANQPKQAIRLARAALAAEERADLHNLLGKAYEADGQRQNSIQELEAALRLDAYEESYYFDLARAHLLSENFDAAVRVLQAGKKVFAKSPQLELAMGVAYYGERRFPEAVDAFLRTAQLAPQLERPYVFLGRMVDQAEDRLSAISAAFTRFAKANPQSYLGPFLWAKARIAQGDESAEVGQLLLRSIALNDRYWESHFELGLVLERKRDFTAAAEQLQRSIELAPGNATPHYRLARIYDRLGKPDLARAERALHERLAAEESRKPDLDVK